MGGGGVGSTVRKGRKFLQRGRSPVIKGSKPNIHPCRKSCGAGKAGYWNS